jgi:hypothetical protein
MPITIEILMQYLAVVVGEVNEIEDIMPDLFNTYVIDGETLNSDMILYPKFKDNGKWKLSIVGYESPFLTIHFGKQMMLLLLVTLVSIPWILIGMKIFKNVPFLLSKLKEIWSSFFFNAPLRTLTELYIEFSLGFFLNSLNVSKSFNF